MTDDDALLALLMEQHRVHCGKNKRRDCTAIGVAAAAWVWRACEREQARGAAVAFRVLELGSGFSSTVLRLWQQQAPPVTDVWTVDDEARWLATTRIELAGLGLPVDNLWDFAVLLAADPGAFAPGCFGLVFVDLDGTGTRVRHAEQFVKWTAPGGLLVLDDWHMAHYREPMTARLAALGLAVVPVPETTDAYGRYLAWARRPVEG
jgi:hypothetical protein